MKRTNVLHRGLLFVAAVSAGCVPCALHAQTRQMPGMPTSPSTMPSEASADAAVRAKIEEQQAQARNTDRQKRLVADSDKLLALATQLHEDVAKTNKNILSLDVVRRAAEMEKLARDLKDRMKE